MKSVGFFFFFFVFVFLFVVHIGIPFLILFIRTKIGQRARKNVFIKNLPNQFKIFRPQIYHGVYLLLFSFASNHSILQHINIHRVRVTQNHLEDFMQNIERINKEVKRKGKKINKIHKTVHHIISS